MALKSDLVDKNTGICLKTSKSAHDVFINTKDLANSVWVLEFGDAIFLYCEDDAIGTFNSDSSRTSVDCFESILDLEKLTIRCEDSDCFVVF